ncbi:hypothetical protein, partial [Azospirillum brasilense]|uniref:hypothetical protein n=1 Tax=Azospirillum brasilense TaxID=192 RepID=UPI001B3B58B2
TLPKTHDDRPAVENRPAYASSGGRFGGPVPHSSYTTFRDVTSTHDLEEARFIERKCRNAGIAFNLCRLHALGKDGVSYSIDEEGFSQ